MSKEDQNQAMRSLHRYVTAFSSILQTLRIDVSFQHWNFILLGMQWVTKPPWRSLLVDPFQPAISQTIPTKYISKNPTRRALEALAEQGISLVITLKRDCVKIVSSKYSCSQCAATQARGPSKTPLLQHKRVRGTRGGSFALRASYQLCWESTSCHQCKVHCET